MRKILILIFLISKSLYSNDKGIEGKVLLYGEEFNFKAKGTNFKAYSANNEFSVLIQLDKNNRENDTINFMDNKGKNYISITRKELEAISNLKKLFQAPKESEKYELFSSNFNKKIIGFNFKEYSSKEQNKINVFFSLDIIKYIKNFMEYECFLDLIKSLDFTTIPIIESYFGIFESLMNYIEKLGFPGEIYVRNEKAYSLKELKECEIENKEFEIPIEYEKKSIENFIE